MESEPPRTPNKGDEEPVSGPPPLLMMVLALDPGVSASTGAGMVVWMIGFIVAENIWKLDSVLGDGCGGDVDVTLRVVVVVLTVVVVVECRCCKLFKLINGAWDSAVARFCS